MLQTVKQKAHVSALLDNAVGHATSGQKEVQAAADYLVFLMEKMHGEQFRADVDHATGFVLVRIAR